jgi:hypothetical protein
VARAPRPRKLRPCVARDTLVRWPSVAFSGLCEEDARREISEVKPYELQGKIHPRNTNGIGYVGAYVCGSQRRPTARRGIGSVPGDRWRMGDLRFALREIEIENSGGWPTHFSRLGAGPPFSEAAPPLRFLARVGIRISTVPVAHTTRFSLYGELRLD